MICKTILSHCLKNHDTTVENEKEILEANQIFKKWKLIGIHQPLCLWLGACLPSFVICSPASIPERLKDILLGSVGLVFHSLAKLIRDNQEDEERYNHPSTTRLR